MRYLLLYFSVMTFNMCFKCVLILVFFRFPKKLAMAQLRHLEIGIDATASCVKDALSGMIPPAPPVLRSLFNLVPADAHFPECHDRSQMRVFV